MLGTTEGGIQDWQRAYGLRGFNKMILRADGELTDFLALFTSNPFNDSTNNLYFPFDIYPRGRPWNQNTPSCICPLKLGTGCDVENQAGCSGPDLAIRFEQL